MNSVARLAAVVFLAGACSSASPAPAQPAPTTVVPEIEAPAPADPAAVPGIEVDSPVHGDTVKSGFTVTGRANTWDGNVFYRVTGGGDQELGAGKLTGGHGEWSDFAGEITFENNCCTEISLELFERREDGTEDLMVTVFLGYSETS